MKFPLLRKISVESFEITYFLSSRKLALTEQFIQRFFRQRIAQKLLKHFWLRRRSIVGKNNLIFENFNCKLTKNFSFWRKRSHSACSRLLRKVVLNTLPPTKVIRTWTFKFDHFKSKIMQAKWRYFRTFWKSTNL